MPFAIPFATTQINLLFIGESRSARQDLPIYYLSRNCYCSSLSAMQVRFRGRKLPACALLCFGAPGKARCPARCISRNHSPRHSPHSTSSTEPITNANVPALLFSCFTHFMFLTYEYINIVIHKKYSQVPLWLRGRAADS